MRIPIVFSTDHNYVMQTGVAILSLMESSGGAVYDIYVIVASDVTSTDRTNLDTQVAKFPGHTISYLSVGNEFDGAFEIRGITQAAYYRLLIPWLLPDIDKIIYSDVDVIFHTSLVEVYKDSLGQNFFAAIPGASFFFRDGSKEYIRELGLNADKYCNSGFLVINSKAQREACLKERYLELAKRRFTYQDQDIINLVCKGRIKFLSPRYCITPVFYETWLEQNPRFKDFYGDNIHIDNYMRGRDCIIHYAGPKPWCSFTFAYTDWWNAYRQSIFYSPEFEIRSQADIWSKLNLRIREIAGLLIEKTFKAIKRK